MSDKPSPATRISTYTTHAIFVRDKDLVEDLIGKLSFTEMTFFQVMGRLPTKGETAILDAVLVTLMEHGLTPSTISARLIYDSAPEALQGAVAGGLLAVGGQFVGTMEGAAQLLERIVDEAEGDGGGVAGAAQRVAEEHRAARQPLPGFGHPLHRPDDPRSPKLMALARDQGVEGRYIAALEALSAAVDEVYGKHITINATGAIAALLLEIGVPWRVMRGFAVISRAAGLVGHILEEQQRPAARHMWGLVAKGVPYEGKAGKAP
jgi:citrate synthase